MTTNNYVGKEESKPDVSLNLFYFGDALNEEEVASEVMEALRRIDPDCNTLMSPLEQPLSPQSSVGVEEMVLLRTESQKDGEHYRVLPRKEAEKIIQRNYEWKDQFKIVCDVTRAMTEYSSLKTSELQKELEYLKQRCDISEELLSKYRWDVPISDEEFEKWQSLKNQKPTT